MADRIVDHPTVTFIRNTWYPALWAGELTPGKLFPRTLLNEPVLFFRREDGTVAAIADTCSHRFAPLSMGQLLPGDRVQCPYHGLEFTGDGRCVLNPHGTGAIPAAAHLRSYPLVERHTVIWIWMGDKPAEPDKIPDFSCMDEADPLNVTEPGHVLMKANYELIVDNLLDNSHTPFVHPGILGNKDLMASEVTVTTRGDIVTLSRIVKNAESPGLLKLMGAVEHGDQWNITDWFAPSCLLLIVGASPAGQPQSAASGFYAIHLLAPETERTTHYNFSAVRFNTPPESEETKQRIRADTARLRGFAFGEQDGPNHRCPAASHGPIGDPAAARPSLYRRRPRPISPRPRPPSPRRARRNLIKSPDTPPAPAHPSPTPMPAPTA